MVAINFDASYYSRYKRHYDFWLYQTAGPVGEVQTCQVSGAFYICTLNLW